MCRDGTHNTGQSAIKLNVTKREKSMTPSGEVASEWEMKHMLSPFFPKKIKKKIKNLCPLL